MLFVTELSRGSVCRVALLAVCGQHYMWLSGSTMLQPCATGNSRLSEYLKKALKEGRPLLVGGQDADTSLALLVPLKVQF